MKNKFRQQLICKKALDKLKEENLFRGCLKFRICPECGESPLEERKWESAGAALGDHLHCKKCGKDFCYDFSRERPIL